ncbi:MAG TPA: TetR/AcrR family transcriptional regulator [Acidimicrobiales bacterium]|nr:TetR/AcrR family transcriptional regulator [Acidimicrobiales bacterium]
MKRRGSRERLLEATYSCVARYGIAKTTVEDVAREAKVSRATVYRIFPGGKDELVRETVRWEATRFFVELGRAVEGAPDFATTVVEAIVFARRALADHAVLQKILETEPGLLLPYLTVDDQRLRGLVAAFLEPHLQPERNRLADHVDVAGACDHVARLTMSFMAAAGSWDLNDQEEVRRLVETQLLSGVFARSSLP